MLEAFKALEASRWCGKGRAEAPMEAPGFKVAKEFHRQLPQGP